MFGIPFLSSGALYHSCLRTRRHALAAALFVYIRCQTWWRSPPFFLLLAERGWRAGGQRQVRCNVMTQSLSLSRIVAEAGLPAPCACPVITQLSVSIDIITRVLATTAPLPASTSASSQRHERKQAVATSSQGKDMVRHAAQSPHMATQQGLNHKLHTAAPFGTNRSPYAAPVTPSQRAVPQRLACPQESRSHRSSSLPAVVSLQSQCLSRASQQPYSQRCSRVLVHHVHGAA